MKIMKSNFLPPTHMAPSATPNSEEHSESLSRIPQSANALQDKNHNTLLLHFLYPQSRTRDVEHRPYTSDILQSHPSKPKPAAMELTRNKTSRQLTKPIEYTPNPPPPTPKSPSPLPAPSAGTQSSTQSLRKSAWLGKVGAPFPTDMSHVQGSLWDGLNSASSVAYCIENRKSKKREVQRADGPEGLIYTVLGTAYAKLPCSTMPRPPLTCDRKRKRSTPRHVPAAFILTAPSRLHLHLHPHHHPHHEPQTGIPRQSARPGKALPSEGGRGSGV
ncbi:hypothetical protein VTK56DRAFT_8442 [Thermocarpiscus australiensis]